MEVLEFIKQKDRMCDYYCDAMCTRDDSDETCPASSIDCEIMTDKPELLVDIVEKWAKEHPEKPEQEQQKPEHPEESSDLHAIIDALEDRIDKLDGKVSNEALIFREVSKRNQYAHRQLADRITALEKYPVESMNKPKRTNKDVLLATFPRMVMDGGVPVLCPRTMDRDIHIQYCAGRSCYQCRCEYWLSEVEE